MTPPLPPKIIEVVAEGDPSPLSLLSESLIGLAPQLSLPSQVMGMFVDAWCDTHTMRM